MTFFQATGLLGTCNTIAGVLISIRKCYKSKKKISKHVSDSLLSLGNIKQAAPQLSRFVEVGGIELRDFCSMAAKIIRIEVDLLNLAAKAVKKNRIHRFCSAPETATALGSIHGKLSRMETEMHLLITTLRSDVKVSVLLETFVPVLAAAEKILPYQDGFEENRRLLTDARKAFGTHVLSSRMNRLIAQTTESVYYRNPLHYSNAQSDMEIEKRSRTLEGNISMG